METNKIRYGVRESVATVVLDEPPVNGYSHEMMRALDEAILRARFDESVHVIVLTGAGEKFFCAGADIQRLAKMDPAYKYNFCLHANETMLRLENTPKLVIAALNGHCVGGGLEVALACDLRVARAGGGKIGLPEVALGVLPGTGGTQRLSRVIGRSRALQMMITGANMSFEEGQAQGLIHEILPSEGFSDAVFRYARGFCPPEKASLAVGLIKRSVLAGSEVPLESGLALERELQQRLFNSADARLGLEAYLAKKKPEFEGR